MPVPFLPILLEKEVLNSKSSPLFSWTQLPRLSMELPTVAQTESILYKLFAITEGHPQQHRK